eukprot:scaffold159577_cov27-Tisochrysis_lutea.AAC.2
MRLWVLWATSPQPPRPPLPSPSFLVRSFSDHMPSNERVQQLLDLEELPSLAEFIQTFDDVTDVTLGSDAVWPAEPPLIF